MKTIIAGPNGVEKRDATEEEIARLKRDKAAESSRAAQAATALTDAAQSDLSPARQLLKRLGGNAPRFTPIPVEILDETVYVRRLDAAGMGQFAVWTARDGQSQLDIGSTDSTAAFYRAVLLCCVCADPNGTITFFTPTDAWEFVTSDAAEVIAAVDVMVAAAIRANPEIVGSNGPAGGEKKEFSGG